MRFPIPQSIGIIVLAILAIGWSELYLPLTESLKVDVVVLANDMTTARTLMRSMRERMPRFRAESENLSQSVADFSQQLASAFSEDLYIAISSAANRLYLRRGRDVIHEAVISTGRRDTLRHEKRKWVFDTPRGIMTVWRKKDKPVWIKPDWAFLEAGESIPHIESPLRRQEGVLGDFLLDLGGGIAIHGTPAEHLLGQSVTHGCIRVGRGDLKAIFDSVSVGTKVYIY